MPLVDSENVKSFYNCDQIMPALGIGGLSNGECQLGSCSICPSSIQNNHPWEGRRNVFSTWGSHVDDWIAGQQPPPNFLGSAMDPLQD